VNLNEDQNEYFSWREINRDSLKMGEALGQGEFGMVVRAMWEDEQNRKSTPVAVKTIKGRWSRVGEGGSEGGG
jgi:hypothetical protein